MNDEIKEILDYYQKEIDKYEKDMKYYYTEYQQKTTFSKNYQRYKNHKIILDYITNLQEENERLNNIIDEIFEWMQNKYDNSDLTGFTVSFQELQDLKELKKVKSKGDE